MKQVYVPKEEITTYPDDWNEGRYNQTETGIESFYSAFLFLNDPREDIYSVVNEMS